MRLLLLVLLLAGCANEAALDARFDAGWRPSHARCAFGGETEKIDAYCAEINFGKDGATYIREREEHCRVCQRYGNDAFCNLNCNPE